MYDDNALPCLLTGRDKHWVAFCSALDVEWLSFGTEFMFRWYCIFTFIFMRISKKKNIDTILCAWTWLFKYRVNCEGYLLYMRICGGDRVLSENRELHVTFSFQMFVWDNRACESRWRGGGEWRKGHRYPLFISWGIAHSGNWVWTVIIRFRNEGRDTYLFRDRDAAYEGITFCRMLK